jgi:hypothetical protein
MLAFVSTKDLRHVYNLVKKECKNGCGRNVENAVSASIKRTDVGYPELAIS